MYLQKGISIKIRKKIFFASRRSLKKRAGFGAGSVSQRYGFEDLHPDPYQNVIDPERWIFAYGSYLSL
jgi:hypothetical protein